MKLTTALQGAHYTFADLKDLFAKANEEKSGDSLAGLAAGSQQERIAAKWVLSEITLSDIRNNPLIPPERDEVSRLIEEFIDDSVYRQWANTTVSGLREWLVHPETTGKDILHISRGLTSEMIAAVAKIMSNLDLIHVAGKINAITTCRTTIGHKGTLASRLQPNHPSDDPDGVRAVLYEGLVYGSGDALIGINPVIDTFESVKRLFDVMNEVVEKEGIPTQCSVLSHITTQMKVAEAGTACDLFFQSLAGTEAGNKSFGISVGMMDEAYDLAMSHSRRGRTYGPNRMYFETGQGSELSAEAHHGVDQMTLESRCYGMARKYKPFLVNTVTGFMGPEYTFSGKQIIRNALEDVFMGKLHGLTMGADVCYTSHIAADQNDMENLGVLLTAAGVQYLIAIPMGDDCMLNYQSLSFQDIASLRQTLGKKPGHEFARWLSARGLFHEGRPSERAGDIRVLVGRG